MGKNRIILALLFLFLVEVLYAQDKHRYVVYLSDKNNSTYSIGNPSQFLSNLAIQKRTDHNIAITEEDLPVSESYIDLLIKNNATPYFRSKWFNAVLVEATANDIALIENKSFVDKTEYVAPTQKLNGELSTVNNTRSSSIPSFGAFNTDHQLYMMSAKNMHADGFTGDGLWIAIFDGGFLGANLSGAFSAVFEEGRLMDVFDYTTGGKDVFKYSDHGTSAWSCIAAKSRESLIGTGFDARFSLYITEDTTAPVGTINPNDSTEFRIEEYNWLFAAERADSAGVDIITSSLGYYDFDDNNMDYTYSQTDGSTSIISRAAKIAIEKGMLVVTSAGNEGAVAWQYVTFPADVKNILSVGAVDSQFNKATFSSVGPTVDNRLKPEVSALGKATTVLNGENVVTVKNGTSFSAPLVAGFAASLWQKYPDATNLQIRKMIMSSGHIATNPNNSIGYGVPNYDFFDADAVPLFSSDQSNDYLTVYPNPVSGNQINIRINDQLSNSEVNFRLYESTGQMLSSKSIDRSYQGDIISLDLINTERGFYILNIETDGYFKNIKILRH